MSDFLYSTILDALMTVIVLLIVVGFHFAAVEDLVVGHQTKNKSGNTACFWVLFLVMGGTILGIIGTLFILGGLSKAGLSGVESEALILGAVFGATSAYFFAHRNIRRLIVFFYPGTTFHSRYFAQICILGKKRKVEKSGIRWLNNVF